MWELPEHFQNVAFFTQHSHLPLTQEDVAKEFPDVKTRLPGSILTGWLTDRIHELTGPNRILWHSGVWSFLPIACVFAAYHTSWLLLMFGLLIRYRTDALLIMLGTFSGLMLNMCAVSWQYFFPWDLPSMCFFTWAILTYDNSKKILPLMTVVWLGALFKETTLCCTLLILFGERWPLKKRAVSFVATIVAFALAKKLLLLAYAVPIPFFSANNFFSNLQLPNNFRLTFYVPGLNHVIFVNAGTLLVMMVLPWRTYRQMLFKFTAILFAVGILLFGVSIEFRVWYEILPLGWILISESILSRGQVTYGNPIEPGLGQSGTIMDERTRRVMKAGGWLGMGVVLAVLGAVLIIADLHPKPGRSQKPAQSISQADRNVRAAPVDTPDNSPANDSSVNLESKARLKLAIELEKSGKFEQEIEQLREIVRINPNNATALNNLAWALASCSKLELRNGKAAVQLATKANELTGYQQPVFIATLAAAYAQDSRFSEAVTRAEKARALALKNGQKEVAEAIEQLLKLFSAGQAVGTTNVP